MILYTCLATCFCEYVIIMLNKFAPLPHIIYYCAYDIHVFRKSGNVYGFHAFHVFVVFFYGEILPNARIELAAPRL